MIPIIDLKALYSSTADSEEEKKRLVKELFVAFSEIGFVYVKNHNIPKEQIEEVFRESKVLFHLPSEVKQKYARDDKLVNQGWVGKEVENLSPGFADYKEAYDSILLKDDKYWPNIEVPKFKPSMDCLFESCFKLSHDLLNLMAIGLGLEDPDFFLKCHQPEVKGCTTLRSLFYPSISKSKATPGQIRCGEHSDYGSITLLFQDGVGGLEVNSRDNGYVLAKPIPDTILVNIGDLMQRWTADKFVSTKHRVLIPEEESIHKEDRQSLAFFVHPDDDCLVECIDGSNKYPPITGLDYVNMRFNATYK